MRCEACGKDGTIDIRATLIRCSFCDAEWGRVNGFWVESKPPRCMEFGGDGKTVEAEPKTCPLCEGTGREGPCHQRSQIGPVRAAGQLRRGF